MRRPAVTRAMFDRRRVFEATFVLVRLAWLGAALVHFTVVDLPVVTFSLEVGVLAVLIAKFHPNLLNALLGPSSDPDAFFSTDRGIRFLVVGSVAVYLAILVRHFDVHVPHGLGHLLDHSLPGGRMALFGSVMLFAFGSAFAIGLYVYVRDSTVLVSTVDNVFQFTRYRHREVELLRLALDRPFARRGIYLHLQAAVCLVLTGLITSIIAFIFALLASLFIRFPELLVVTVVCWLGYDVWARRFDTTAHRWELLAQVSEEIDAPKEWFLDVEVVEFGLKGVVATMAIVLGLFASVLSFGSVVISVPELGLEMFHDAVAGTSAGHVASSTSVRSAVVIGLLIVPITVTTALVLAYTAYCWYVLFDRLEIWVQAYHGHDPAVDDPEALPPHASVTYPGLSIAYFAVAWTFRFDLTYLEAVLLVIAEFGFVLWVVRRAHRNVRSLEYRPTLGSIRRDNLRIPHFLSTSMVVPFAFTQPAADTALLVVFVVSFLLLYFIGEFDRWIERRIEARPHVGAVLDTYALLVAVGIVFATTSLVPELSPLVYFLPVIGVVLYGSTFLEWFFERTDLTPEVDLPEEPREP